MRGHRRPFALLVVAAAAAASLVRVGVALALLGLLAVALAACAGSGQSGATSAGESSQGASTTAPSTSTWSATASGTGSATTPSCPTSGLAVWLGLGEGGAAAGSTFYPLEFTNVSESPCRLFGFPGVSARDAHQLGSAAGRNRSHPSGTVTLAPGATAHAVLQITDVLNFPAGKCKPVTASTLRVYPPDQSSYGEIPFSFPACSREGEIFLSVEPIEPGVGVPGHPDL